MAGVVTRAYAVGALAVGLVGCAPTGSSLDEESEPARSPSLEARPSAPAPRAPTPEGCPFLDPEPTGPSVDEGVVLDAIAVSLAMQPGRPRVAWVQPARPPATVTEAPLYLAMADDGLRRCFVRLDRGIGAAVCDGSPQMGDFVGPVPATAPGAELTLRAARAAALHDRATRVLADRELARRCTPAPEEVLARIDAPRWRTTEEGTELVFVEELHPRPELARLVEARVRPFPEGADVRRTELWSWSPRSAP